MKRYTLAAVAALLALVPWHGSVRADAPLYTVQNLGTFNGEVPTIAGVNAAGQVVGNVSGAYGSQAVRYTNGRWEALPGLDQNYSTALGMNDAGDIAGYRITPAGEFRAFRYRDGFLVDDIAPLPGGSLTLGYAINGAGDVVGYSDTPGGSQPFLARVGLAPVALPSLGNSAFACGINAGGQVAGVSSTPTAKQHGFRLDYGAAAATDIQSLDGATPQVSICAIDADGRVGGQAAHGGVPRAFLWNGTGLDVDPVGSSESNIEAIANGVAVGWYTVGAGAHRAFAYRDAEGSFDLNSRIDAPGWVLALAKGVNRQGVIVGEGTFNGAPAVFMLTPSAPADTTAPVISSVSATPAAIYPPSGQSVNVAVSVAATDDSGAAPVCSLASVTVQGAATPDAAIAPPLGATVKAVANRTYTFNVSCADAANNTATSSVDVTVLPDTTAPGIASVRATPDTIWPPDGRVVTVRVAVSATDDVDAAPACALSGITGFTPSGDTGITGPLTAALPAVGGRTYGLVVRCTDTAGNAATATANVVVPPDTTAPVVTALSASPAFIWPANGKWVAVSVSASATDDVDAAPVCRVSGISGAPASDYTVTGDFSAKVRAARNADGSTREYLVEVSCNDAAGNVSRAAVTVTVGKDGVQKVYHYNARIHRLVLGLRHGRGR
jgi:hypothetical protein